MNTSIQTFNFNDLALETITDDNGDVWFLATPLAKFLDYKNPAEAIRTNVDNDEVRKIYIPTKSNSYTFVNESGLYSLVFRSNKPEAKLFKKWVTSEVIPSIRRTGTYTATNTSSLPPMPEAAQAAIIFADYLRLSESSKLALLDTVNVRYGNPMVLPSYAVDAPPSEISSGSSMPVSSATELLKQHDIGISAIAFNKLLEANGFLETLTRKSTGTKTKQYKSVTKKGLEFGKNDIDKNNPKQTQPHWYIHKFSELVDLVSTIEKAA